jgi:hypothetical protein
MPPLNIQIPNKKDFRKYTINEKAKVITLSEIIQLKQDKNLKGENND